MKNFKSICIILAQYFSNTYSSEKANTNQKLKKKKYLDLINDKKKKVIMSDFYKLIEIDGKGLGCIATKMIKPGTLIFSERPGVTTTGDYPESIYFKTLMSSFKNLTPNEQKEYMELHIHNRFGEEPLDTILPKDLFEEMNPYETETYSALVLKVSGIYSTNTFSDGVGLKMAR